MLRERIILEILNNMKLKCIFDSEGIQQVTQYNFTEELKDNKLYLIMSYIKTQYKGEGVHSELFMPLFDSNGVVIVNLLIPNANDELDRNLIKFEITRSYFKCSYPSYYLDPGRIIIYELS